MPGDVITTECKSYADWRARSRFVVDYTLSKGYDPKLVQVLTMIGLNCFEATAVASLGRRESTELCITR